MHSYNLQKQNIHGKLYYCKQRKYPICNLSVLNKVNMKLDILAVSDNYPMVLKNIMFDAEIKESGFFNLILSVMGIPRNFQSSSYF